MDALTRMDAEGPRGASYGEAGSHVRQWSVRATVGTSLFMETRELDVFAASSPCPSIGQGFGRSREARCTFVIQITPEAHQRSTLHSADGAVLRLLMLKSPVGSCTTEYWGTLKPKLVV